MLVVSRPERATNAAAHVALEGSNMGRQEGADGHLPCGNAMSFHRGLTL